MQVKRINSSAASTHRDALDNILSIGDRVAFMTLIAGNGYASNTIGHGIISKFTPKMVGIATGANTMVLRLPSRIVKTYNQG